MYTFKKPERLCSEKSIERLFTSGHSTVVYPFRVVWIGTEEKRSFPVRLAIAVPKKKIRKASLRNRVKRLVREAYRLNKQVLYDALIKCDAEIDMMLIYLPDEICSYGETEAGIKKVINSLVDFYETGKENI